MREMRVKKVLAAVMALAMVCLSGCGQKVTAESVIKKATEKQQAQKSMDSDMKMKMSMSADGESLDYDMDMHILASGIGEDNMKMSMETTASVLGQEINMDMYYTDGWYYMDILDQKTKMEMDISEIEEQMKQNSLFTEISMDAYKSLELKEENGGYVVTYVADGTKLTEMVDSLMGSMLSGTLGDMDGMDMTLGDVSGTITTDKDCNVTAQTMKMTMTMSIEGTEMESTIDMDMTVNNPGQEVTVELPDDLDTYAEAQE